MCGLGKPEPCCEISAVALDPWDHRGRRVTPMLAMCATPTVVMTVAPDTQCARYGLTCSSEASNRRQDPELNTSYITGIYIHLQVIIVSITGISSIFGVFLRFSCDFGVMWSC